MIAVPKQQAAPALEILAANIARLRSERGWSQGYLAEQVGVTRVTLNRIERGHASPTWETACALADAFGVSLDALRRDFYSIS